VEPSWQAACSCSSGSAAPAWSPLLPARPWPCSTSLKPCTPVGMPCPGYIDQVQRVIGRVQETVNDVAEKREDLRQILAK